MDSIVTAKQVTNRNVGASLYFIFFFLNKNLSKIKLKQTVASCLFNCLINCKEFARSIQRFSLEIQVIGTYQSLKLIHVLSDHATSFDVLLFSRTCSDLGVAADI